MRKKRQGIALMVVLSVLVLLLIILLAVSSRGVSSLSAVKGLGASHRSLAAAEAAVSVGIHGLVNDRLNTSGFSRQKYTENALYGLEVYNNLSGGADLPASNGLLVKPGFVYLLGQGSRDDGGFVRTVGALVRPVTGSSLNFAMGAGGEIEMRQHTTIKGGLKANGDIHLKAQLDVLPEGGNGRLLSSSSIRAQGPTHMDASQDARARGTVRGQVWGTDTVVENDITQDTLPFLNDGRTTSTLQPGEQGQVLPYPDLQLLLEADAAGNPGPAIESHPETSRTSELDLGGKTHWFPNGIRFEAGARVVGTGTIVVGNGHEARFDCDLGPGLALNVLALYPETGGVPDFTVGSPDIRFEGETDIEGLVLAGHDLRVDRRSSIKGQLIAYKGDLRCDMFSTFTMFPEVMGRVAGLSGFSSGQGALTSGSGPVTVLSWQRF